MMHSVNSHEYLNFLVALMAIVNPVGAVPLFINLTSDQKREERRKTSLAAGVSAGIIMLVVLATGEIILRFFGITVASFRVGGGILILLMAISMLHARMSDMKHTEEEALDSEAKQVVGVVPLGTPLLAGPGAISTVILYAQHDQSPMHYIILAAEIVLVAFVTWLVLLLAPKVSDLLGRTGINIVTRLMGLVMAAVGVEFIANGLRQLFPILAG